MARLAVDTRAQESWKELIEKEAATRMLLKFKNEQNKDEDSWFNKAKYTQNRSFTTSQLPSIVYPPRPERKKPADTLLELASKVSESKNLSEMKPVDSNLKDLIYDGLAKEQRGRYQYLKKRKSENPEDKYEFPILSSWEYGWHLKDVVHDFRTPANGRSKIVEESFYRRNGVFEFTKH